MKPKTIYYVIIGLWVLRGFMIGPCEPIFGITFFLAAWLAFRCVDRARTIAIGLLVVSAVGLFFDIRSRVEERALINQNHQRLIQMKFRQPHAALEEVSN